MEDVAGFNVMRRDVEFLLYHEAWSIAMTSLEAGFRAVALGVVVNVTLAVIKIVTGVVGNSYALIADGIESTADIASSLIVWSGLRIAALPPDDSHPYGHGKAESIAGIIAALGLLAAAGIIATQSVREILLPHHSPEWFTLPVLLVVIAVKELLFRFVLRTGRTLESTSLLVDAWHHRSDALTSVAVFIGITVALVGGKGYESADDWAALIACGVIALNGIGLLRSGVGEIMDATVSLSTQNAIRKIACGVESVLGIEKMRVRKSGLGLLMDIHVQVDGALSVTKSHEIAHRVKDRLIASDLRIKDVVVHVEPKK
jgi:cation diffusion facilitator family transporter